MSVNIYYNLSITLTASSTLKRAIPERMLDHEFFGNEEISRESSENQQVETSNDNGNFHFDEEYTQ